MVYLPTLPILAGRCAINTPRVAKKERNKFQIEKKRLTRQVPGLAFVEVDFGNGMDSEAAVNNLLGEVVGHKLLVRGVKPEARR